MKMTDPEDELSSAHHLFTARVAINHDLSPVVDGAPATVRSFARSKACS
jgi:hypothetical protein